MSDSQWDDDDFQPAPSKKNDKWEGEDEDDSVKDNWDDDDEDENKAKASVVKKKKKKLADVIAEKEQKALEDRLRRQKLREEEAKKMTPAEKLAEKKRMQKIQEDSDLILASDMLGGDDDDEDSDCFDDIEFEDQESLSQFRDMLIKKVRSTDRLEKRAYYYEFVESLVRGLCENMEQDDVKRISTSVNTLYNEKVKANRPKGKKKGAGKAKLNVGQGMIADTSGLNDDFVDYEDFI